jgi:hypothetical protein
MKTKYLMLAFAAPAALAAAPADAATFTFTMTGAYNAAFSIDQSRINPPSTFDGNQFIVDAVAGTFAGAARTANSVTFNVTSFNGGLNIELDGEFFDFRGPQLFSGTTQMPTFLTGSFALTDNNDSSRTATLQITDGAVAAIPEPATWGMMFLGFGMAGYSMRRRGARVRMQAAA